MVVGGLVTLIWDNRLRLISSLTSHLRPARSLAAQTGVAPAQSDFQAERDPEDIEPSNHPTRTPSGSSKKSINNVPTSAGVPEVIHDVVQGSSSRATGGVHSIGSSSRVHRRTRSLYSSPGHERPDIGERTPLLTLGAKPAIAMTVAFVALVIAFVVMKSTVSSLGRPFNVSQFRVGLKINLKMRGMQFFVNMLIAGVIIFGGGPVVIPLLRGYTVDNGMYLADGDQF